jgi:hypothetical protein
MMKCVEFTELQAARLAAEINDDLHQKLAQHLSVSTRPQIIAHNE